MSDEPNNITKLLKVFLASIQDVQNAAQQMMVQRTLETSEGAQLDVIGAIVGQPRGGMDDDDFRRFCRARIAVHRSDGTMEDILGIARLVLEIEEAGHLIIRGVRNATFTLEVRDFPVTSAPAKSLHQLLTIATAGGVRIVIVYSARPYSELFRLDTGPGLDNGHLARAVDAYSTDP